MVDIQKLKNKALIVSVILLFLFLMFIILSTPVLKIYPESISIDSINDSAALEFKISGLMPVTSLSQKINDPRIMIVDSAGEKAWTNEFVGDDLRSEIRWTQWVSVSKEYPPPNGEYEIIYYLKSEYNQFIPTEYRITVWINI